MIKSEFICDRCGTTQQIEEQMWTVFIGIVYGANKKYQATTGKLHADWCRACCEQFDLLPSEDPKPAESKPPTLEDFIREIIRQELP